MSWYSRNQVCADTLTTSEVRISILGKYDYFVTFFIEIMSFMAFKSFEFFCFSELNFWRFMFCKSYLKFRVASSSKKIFFNLTVVSKRTSLNGLIIDIWAWNQDAQMDSNKIKPRFSTSFDHFKHTFFA